MRIKGPGAGEFSIGSGDGESSLQTESRHVKETLQKFQGDSSTGKSLENFSISKGFDPSNVDGRIFRNR